MSNPNSTLCTLEGGRNSGGYASLSASNCSLISHAYRMNKSLKSQVAHKHNRLKRDMALSMSLVRLKLNSKFETCRNFVELCFGPKKLPLIATLIGSA